MLPVAFSLGVLLALMSGTATQHCDEPQDLISRMLRQLHESVKKVEAPNPSVLLAMNLAGDTNSDIRNWLLQRIKEKAVDKAQDMTSGDVALSVLALLSSCQDPQRVWAKGQTIDLVSILQKKTQEEIAYMDKHGYPKTTLFSVSLDSLALCLVQAAGYQEAAVALAKKVVISGKEASVDTRAMAVQALVCTYGHVDSPVVQEQLRNALSTTTKDFLEEQEKRGGMIGNIYSMGLALQALQVSRQFYAPQQWDCSQAFAVVHRHDYQQPMAIAQVLPALVDKSYLDAASVNCDANTGMLQGGQVFLSSKPGTAEVVRGAAITVHYYISNKLKVPHFDYSISVEVPDGSTLLTVLQAAQELKPSIFSFQTKQTQYGPMVISIHGLEDSSSDRTFWQFLSGGIPIPEGVGTYKPCDGEVISAVFSTY